MEVKAMTVERQLDEAGISEAEIDVLFVRSLTDDSEDDAAGMQFISCAL